MAVALISGISETDVFVSGRAHSRWNSFPSTEMDSEDLDEAAGTNAFASPFETAAQTASEPAADVSAESTPHIRHPLVPSDEAELNDCLAAFVADENAKQMSSFEKYMAENGQEIPRLLAEIRSWGAFNVTDFVQQSWCEVKGRLRMRQDFGLDELDVVAVKVGDMPQVKMGRIIHEKKGGFVLKGGGW